MTKRKDPKDYLKPGAPTTYKPEYCERVIEHMRQGYTFNSFAGLIGTHRGVLWEWTVRHPSFSDAKKKGTELLEKHYIDMGRAIATGQLRRLKSERPMVGPDGKPMIDPATGHVLMDRQYEQTLGNATAWIFMCKNLLGWRNENHHLYAINTDKDKQNARALELPEPDRMKEIRDMTKLLEESYFGEKPVIEIKKAE